MKVIIKGTIDLSQMSNEELRPYASYVIEKAREFFGKPENMKEFEDWCRKRNKVAV